MNRGAQHNKFSPYGWNVLKRLGAEFCILPNWPEY